MQAGSNYSSHVHSGSSGIPSMSESLYPQKGQASSVSASSSGSRMVIPQRGHTPISMHLGHSVKRILNPGETSDPAGEGSY